MAGAASTQVPFAKMDTEADPLGDGLETHLQAMRLQREETDSAAESEEGDDSESDDHLDDIYDMERRALPYKYPEPVRIGTHERAPTALAETVFAYAR